MKNILQKIGAGWAVAAIAAAFALPAFASTSTVYNNGVTNPLPGNVPSVGAEAYAFEEFGGQIQLSGTERYNPAVTVMMSSWGCQTGTWFNHDCITASGATFSIPITLNIYNVVSGNTPGTKITSVTQTFTIPYRPSADSTNCTGANAGKWFDGSTCFNGKASTITFNLAGQTLPDKIIVSVAYNTTHYGYAPIGESAPCFTSSGGCFYDSLNIGLGYPPSVGADPLPNDVYQYSNLGGEYCDNGTGGTGTFRLDAGCWTGYQPTIKVEAQPALVLPPTNKDQCKDGSWQKFNNPAFKNQGECVSYVQANVNAGKKVSPF